MQTDDDTKNVEQLRDLRYRSIDGNMNKILKIPGTKMNGCR